MASATSMAATRSASPSRAARPARRPSGPRSARPCSAPVVRRRAERRGGVRATGGGRDGGPAPQRPTGTVGHSSSCPSSTGCWTWRMCWQSSRIQWPGWPVRSAASRAASAVPVSGTTGSSCRAWRSPLDTARVRLLGSDGSWMVCPGLAGLVWGRWWRNQAAARAATRSRAPGSSNRWLAPGNDLEGGWTAQLGLGLAVELQHLLVVAAHDQQGRGPHLAKPAGRPGRAGHPGTPPP